MKDLVGRRRRRAVRALDDRPRLDEVRVLGVDHAAERGRDQDLALEADELVGVDDLDAGELRELAAVVHVAPQGVDVDAGLAVDRAERVRDADDLRPEVRR